ncbi:MAG: flagellar biosynthesis anti-sigma factor FlgM [Oscillospiraceae bacterium]|nr:flagellar biosynthesis anti-sigma factor FlgM [Oscillospiraceae bacterium]
MKINPIVNPNILRSYQATKPTREVGKQTSGRDEVTFSKEALNFSKALSEAKEVLEFRTPEEKARIAEIKEAVNKGEYKVDSMDIADKILSSIIGRP